MVFLQKLLIIVRYITNYTVFVSILSYIPGYLLSLLFIVVEHDRDALKAADYVVELGPGAGENGGAVVIEGDPAVIEASDSQSGAFLRGELTGVVPAEGGRRKPERWIRVLGCAENNLKKIDVVVPRGVLASLCGLSGSGKSTFLYEILYKGLRMKLDRESSRSEERRVGKECRSRWSPYH